MNKEEKNSGLYKAKLHKADEKVEIDLVVEDLESSDDSNDDSDDEKQAKSLVLSLEKQKRLAKMKASIDNKIKKALEALKRKRARELASSSKKKKIRFT